MLNKLKLERKKQDEYQLKQQQDIAKDLKLKKEQQQLRQEYVKEQQDKQVSLQLIKDGNLDQLIQIFQQKKATTTTIFIKAIQLLFQLCQNLLHEFSDPRARHIKKNNPIIFNTLVKPAGAIDLLLALGFIEKELNNLKLLLFMF